MITFAVIALICLTCATIATCKNFVAVRVGATALCRRSLSIPIVMPVYGRPHYLRQVIQALSRVNGIDRAVLVISQDGKNEEVTSLVAGIRFTNVVVVRHTRPFLGLPSLFWDGLYAVSANIFFLLDLVLSRADAQAAIVLEDDVVPAPDFLEYFAWAHEHLLSSDEVMTVTGFNLHSRPWLEKGYHPRDFPHEMVPSRRGDRGCFSGWGWAMSRIMWRRVRRSWSFLSWDIGLDKTQQRRGLVSYKPVLARTKHIGMRGINFTESEQNPKWQGLFIADENIDYSRLPRLLPDDPCTPPYCDEKPRETIRNERSTTRYRRWVMASVVMVMTLLEIYFVWMG